MTVKQDAMVATMSDAIIEARYSLTPKQNDIIDMLLCEIKDDSNYQYAISVEKYKQLYITDTSNLYRDLKRAAESFEGKGFKVINKDTNEAIYYAWFSKIHYIPKKAEIRVNIDLDFKKILYEVKKKIYYNLEYTLNFSSQYSRRIYYYLKSFEDTGWRIDNVDTLQLKLECPKSYSNFYLFKKNVLDSAEDDINKKSDLKFTYETKKKGRKVTHIKFNIISGKQKKRKSPNIEVLQDNNVSLVKQFTGNRLSDDNIISLLKASNNNVKLIKEKYDLMLQQKVVYDIYHWLKSALEKDYKKEKYEQISCFNNYEQRTYDYDELEKQLLGWTNN